MDWVVIIDIFLKVISECMKKRSRESIVEGLQNPGLVEILVIWNVLRGKGLRGRNLRDAIKECLNGLESMSNSEIADFVNEAEEAN